MICDLTNKRFLLTGANGHLGFSIAKEILKSGGELISISRNVTSFNKKINIFSKDLAKHNHSFQIDLQSDHILKLNIKKIKKYIKSLCLKKYL